MEHTPARQVSRELVLQVPAIAVSFRDFQMTLKREWAKMFGWSSEDDVNAKGVPYLEKVSYIIHC